MIQYKVRYFQDDRWEVYSIDTDTYEEVVSGLYFAGLADCEAWIRLTDGGYMT